MIHLINNFFYNTQGDRFDTEYLQNDKKYSLGSILILPHEPVGSLIQQNHFYKQKNTRN